MSEWDKHMIWLAIAFLLGAFVMVTTLATWDIAKLRARVAQLESERK